MPKHYQNRSSKLDSLNGGRERRLFSVNTRLKTRSSWDCTHSSHVHRLIWTHCAKTYILVLSLSNAHTHAPRRAEPCGCSWFPIGHAWGSLRFAKHLRELAGVDGCSAGATQALLDEGFEKILGLGCVCGMKFGVWWLERWCRCLGSSSPDDLRVLRNIVPNFQAQSICTWHLWRRVKFRSLLKCVSPTWTRSSLPPVVLLNLSDAKSVGHWAFNVQLSHGDMHTAQTNIPPIPSLIADKVDVVRRDIILNHDLASALKLLVQVIDFNW